MKRYEDPAQALRSKVYAWALKLRVNPRLIRVRDMRRKWGSCSSSGVITLARDLADQAEGFQDYVIVHELLHLRHRTHGRLFRALLSAYLPGWRAYAAGASASAPSSAAPTMPMCPDPRARRVSR
ncbi:MAG: M48 family metallopeptidase [Thiobacillaceae bacterium]|nr:M48 family metallopeptidase [Thiobacillaceae bacterium]